MPSGSQKDMRLLRGRALGSDAPCGGIWAALRGKLGVSSGAVIYGGLSQGARGRQRPAEEVIRVLPGAGSRERGLEAPAPFAEI